MSKFLDLKRDKIAFIEYARRYYHIESFNCYGGI